MCVQITSKLHRQQLVRAMKRVILGLGAVPSTPQDLQCKQVRLGLQHFQIMAGGLIIRAATPSYQWDASADRLFEVLLCPRLAWAQNQGACPDVPFVVASRRPAVPSKSPGSRLRRQGTRPSTSTSCREPQTQRPTKSGCPSTGRWMWRATAGWTATCRC